MPGVVTIELVFMPTDTSTPVDIMRKMQNFIGQMFTRELERRWKRLVCPDLTTPDRDDPAWWERVSRRCVAKVCREAIGGYPAGTVVPNPDHVQESWDWNPKTGAHRDVPDLVIKQGNDKPPQPFTFLVPGTEGKSWEAQVCVEYTWEDADLLEEVRSPLS